MFKYNQVFFKSIVGKSFTTYDRLITYSFSCNELFDEWFYQSINPSNTVDAFAPFNMNESNPESSNKFKYKRKQISLVHLWALNAELYIDKIQKQEIYPSDFISQNPTLTMSLTPSMTISTNALDVEVPKSTNRIVFNRNNSTKQETFQSDINQSQNDDTDPVIRMKPMYQINNYLVDESLIGREAFFSYQGYGDVQVKIQNFSVGYQHIYLEILEDSFPGPNLIMVEISQVAEKISKDKCWINPNKLKIIA